jgi:acetolactate synthase-1/2/3 large subunit
MTQTGAQLFAQCLLNQGVERIFGIPGAKIDALFDALIDTPIEVIVCRHEQNAAFMAASYGRLTGKPGVVLVTSGPGVTNLVTGLLTANTEGDPVVAIGGNVPRAMKYKASHQQADNVALLAKATQFSAEVPVVEAIPEIIANAFRAATLPRSGAAFISVPQDVLFEQTDAPALEAISPPELGPAAADTLQALATALQQAERPVLLLGEASSAPPVAQAVRALLAHHALPVVSTYQAAGVISRDLVDNFAGRVGLFNNQPGDQLLHQADCIVTVGFNPAEYDPEVWHTDARIPIFHLDNQPCQIRGSYEPKLECVGGITKSLQALCDYLPAQATAKNAATVKELQQNILTQCEQGKNYQQMPVHPLRFIHELRTALDDEAIVISDIGSHYMWLARYFWSYEPRHLLFSNGQQTLGVALPWALGAHFANPQQQIISISGDGGFLFSAMELETAVRVGANFIHFVWVDGHYDMVREQQKMKYNRDAAVAFGQLDLVSFAKAFGAVGIRLQDPREISNLIETHRDSGPVLVEVPIDYSDNGELFAAVQEHIGN